MDRATIHAPVDQEGLLKLDQWKLFLKGFGNALKFGLLLRELLLKQLLVHLVLSHLFTFTFRVLFEHRVRLNSILLLKHLNLLLKHLDLIGLGSGHLLVGHDWRPKLTQLHIRVQMVLMHVVIHLPLLKLLLIQSHIVDPVHAVVSLRLYHFTVTI